MPALRGIRRVDEHFKLTMIASNLSRLARMPGVVSQGATRRAATA
jgi:hypothetical protein